MKNLAKRWLPLFFFLAGVLSAGTPGWVENYEEGKQRALQENKLILVMLSREGCDMCDYMKEAVLPDPAVREYMEAHFVPVEIDLAKSKAPTGLRAFGTPTFYFLCNEGKKIGRQMVGAAKKEAFLERLKQAVRDDEQER